MSNLLQRLLLFFIGLPLLILAFIFLPGWRHAAPVAIIILFGICCSIELARIVRSRGTPVSTVAFAAIGGLFPLAAYLGVLFLDDPSGMSGIGFVGILAGVGMSIILSPLAFARSKDIPGILPRASAYALDLGYIGLLSAILALIACEPRYATESMLSFLLISLSNDTLAWFFGNLFGRKRGIVAVSPNKSAVGFAGGMAGSIATAYLARAIFPGVLRASWWELLVLGTVVGAAAMIGDLVESALKRSAGVKDSGNLIPGRGGFLDSLDSLLLSGPFFYGLSLAMGLFR